MVHILLLFQLILNCMCFIVAVQLLSHVQLFVTPWAAAHQAPCPPLPPKVCLNSHPLSQWCYLTISSSAIPFSFCLQSSQHQGFFSNELALHIKWSRYWSFSFSISPSNEYSGMISLRTDWLDLLAVQGTLKSLLQHHSLKASVLQCSVYFMFQLSHLYVTIGKTIVLTTWTFLAKWCPCFLIHCLGLS